jgi:hypothetical protein
MIQTSNRIRCLTSLNISDQPIIAPLPDYTPLTHKIYELITQYLTYQIPTNIDTSNQHQYWLQLHKNWSDLSYILSIVQQQNTIVRPEVIHLTHTIFLIIQMGDTQYFLTYFISPVGKSIVSILNSSGRLGRKITLALASTNITRVINKITFTCTLDIRRKLLNAYSYFTDVFKGHNGVHTRHLQILINLGTILEESQLKPVLNTEKYSMTFSY